MPPPKNAINYQLLSNWCRLEGKPESTTYEHYYLFEEYNGNIQVKIISDTETKPSLISKDLVMKKNKHQNSWSNLFKSSARHLLAIFKGNEFKDNG
ncbi:hypothetical protein [Xenorhabdus littoralis]|nr:hypothetical protein [Xenorhabdus sp. Reich]